MKLSNSIKLVMTNFNLFWKLLIYMIVCIAITGLLLMPVSNIFVTALKDANFINEATKLFNGVAFQGLGMFMSTISSVILTFVNALGILAQNGVAVLIYIVFILFVFFPFLFHISNIATSECVYSYMTSLRKNSFVVSLLDKFGLSVGYSILKTLFELPFYALLVWLAYIIAGLGSISGVMQFITPLIWIICMILVLDLKATILGGWAQSIVTFNVCATRAIKKGFKSVSRNYLATLSSFAVVITIAFSVVVLFGAFALVLIVPLFSLITCVFGQVLFFESQGMDYYTSQVSIIKPRKLEQSDSIKKVKFKI